MITKHWKRHVPGPEGGDVEQRVEVEYHCWRETVYVRGFGHRQRQHRWTVHDVTAPGSPLLTAFSSEDACRFWLLDQRFRSFVPTDAHAVQEASG